MATSTFPPPDLKQAAEQVAVLLQQRHETIAVAETAAGGLVSAALLATPGASRFYRGGLTLYTLESRLAFAGWTQSDIDGYDGPTPKLVQGLASHVRDTLKSTYCVGEVGFQVPFLLLSFLLQGLEELEEEEEINLSGNHWKCRPTQVNTKFYSYGSSIKALARENNRFATATAPNATVE